MSLAYLKQIKFNMPATVATPATVQAKNEGCVATVATVAASQEKIIAANDGFSDDHTEGIARLRASATTILASPEAHAISEAKDLADIAALDAALTELANLANWQPDELVMCRSRRRRMPLDCLAPELERVRETIATIRGGSQCIALAEMFCLIAQNECA